MNLSYNNYLDGYADDGRRKYGGLFNDIFVWKQLTDFRETLDAYNPSWSDYKMRHTDENVLLKLYF